MKYTHYGYLFIGFDDFVEDEVRPHRNLEIASSEFSGLSSNQFAGGQLDASRFNLGYVPISLRLTPGVRGIEPNFAEIGTRRRR
jgi:hypothetical protein